MSEPPNREIQGAVSAWLNDHYCPCPVCGDPWCLSAPPRCTDFTKSGRGWLRCNLPAGHDTDPLSKHQVDPFGPVAFE
jgi:hypothetical protein